MRSSYFLPDVAPARHYETFQHQWVSKSGPARPSFSGDERPDSELPNCLINRISLAWHGGCNLELSPISTPVTESILIDRRLSKEDIDWLRKLRNAKAANQLSADIPTSVVRRLTQLACAEVRGGKYSITFRGRDELIERERELS
jgi:hypothetical protein